MDHAYIKQDELFTVIEIGTGTIKVLMATMTDEGKIKILARGKARTNRNFADNIVDVNVRKGEIRNLPEVRKLLQEAVAEAEQGARRRIQEGFIGLGVTGNNIQVKEVSATRTLPTHGTITEEDVVEAVRLAKDKGLAEKKENEILIGTYSRGYWLENGQEIGNPVGSVSGSLTAGIHCVSIPRRQIECLSHLLIPEWLRYDRTLFFNYLPMATGLAVWTEEELAEGVLSVDIGAGVTSYSVYKNDLALAGHFLVGCEHIENDLMNAFGISRSRAHQILCQPPEQERMNIMNADDRRARLIAFDVESPTRMRQRCLPVSSIELVIRLRLREIFQIVREELYRSGVLSFSRRMVALSGGAALIPGTLALAKEVFECPGRIATARQDLFDFQAAQEWQNNPQEIVPLGCLVKLLKDVQTVRAINTQRGAGEEHVTSFLTKYIKHFWNTVVNW